MYSQPDLDIKMVFLGDQQVGKSCLIQTFLNGHFPDCTPLNVFDNKVTHCKYSGKIIKLSIWDTCGSSQYDKLRPLSYTRADIFLICFALDNPRSFHNSITRWIDEVDKYNPNAIKMFVCTKIDKIPNQFDKIDFSQKPSLPFFIIQRKIAALGYKLASCSSVCYEKVDECFNTAIKLVGEKVFGKHFSEEKQKTECSIF